MQSVSGLYIANTDQKGRGVFTAQEIHKGQLIEVAPVVVVTEKDKALIHKTVLHDYYFNWGENDNQAAIGLGFVSIYNHASNPNADYNMFQDAKVIEIRSLRVIDPGEEITIDYGQGKQSLWFDVK